MPMKHIMLMLQLEVLFPSVLGSHGCTRPPNICVLRGNNMWFGNNNTQCNKYSLP